jgi:hypothetical protein
MTVPATHDRDDDSAWKGNGGLAFVTGLIVGALSSDAGRLAFTVDLPEGYAPVIDLTFKATGKRFRLRLEDLGT